MKFLVSAFAILALSSTTAFAKKSNNLEAISKPKISFGNLKDGDKVKSPFKVVMKAQNIKVRPAGEDAEDKASGHHHLIIDGEAIPTGQPVPADDKHIHFGKGQTETEVSLPVGKHTLTLQFADGAHRSYGATQSQTIKIEVTEEQKVGGK